MESQAILELFGRVRRQVNLLATQELSRFGVGPKQAILIRYLARHQPISMADLARATVTDPAAVGRAIDGLMKKSWVTQQEHPDDRRCWRLSLTREGMVFAKRIQAVYRKIAHHFCVEMTAEERQMFGQQLLKIRQRLNSTLEENHR